MAYESLIGNTSGLALKDKDMRQRAYKSFCDHLANGKVIKSWWFEEGDCSVCWATMLEYIKDTTEFDPNKRKVAEARGLQKWEEVCEDSANGKNKNANTASLQMVMRNKFGWDKAEETKTVNVNLKSVDYSKLDDR